MYSPLKKLLFKTIALVLITLLPISVYLYTKDNGQYIFNINGRDYINKYIIRAEFFPDDKKVEMEQNIKFVNNTSKDLNKIYFHIYPNVFKDINTTPFYQYELTNAYPNGFDPGYIEIEEIKIDGEKCRFIIFGKDNSILAVNLEAPLQAGKRANIYLKCSVKIPNCKGRFGYDTNTYNITNWYPIVAVHDDSGWNLDPYYKMGDPFYSDTSNYHVEFVTPEKYIPATTGKIIRQEEIDNKICYFIEANNVRDFAIIVSDQFKIEETKVDDIKVFSYYFNDKYKNEALEYAADSIKIFNEIFGQYPYEEYKVVACDFFVGGMEYPNLVMIDNEMYHYQTSDILEYIIAHETAHQWWYGIVGSDQIDEPWLDESLTEYSTILYYENKYGKEVSEKVFDTMIVGQYNSFTQDINENQFINKKITQFDSDREYISLVYHKGAMNLKRFRESIGDEIFFTILKEYFNKYKFSNSTTEEFIKICEDVIGKEHDINVKEILSIKDM